MSGSTDLLKNKGSFSETFYLSFAEDFCPAPRFLYCYNKL